MSQQNKIVFNPMTKAPKHGTDVLILLNDRVAYAYSYLGFFATDRNIETEYKMELIEGWVALDECKFEFKPYPEHRPNPNSDVIVSLANGDIKHAEYIAEPVEGCSGLYDGYSGEFWCFDHTVIPTGFIPLTEITYAKPD